MYPICTPGRSLSHRLRRIRLMTIVNDNTDNDNNSKYSYCWLMMLLLMMTAIAVIIMVSLMSIATVGWTCRQLRRVRTWTRSLRSWSWWWRRLAGSGPCVVLVRWACVPTPTPGIGLTYTSPERNPIIRLTLTPLVEANLEPVTEPFQGWKWALQGMLYNRGLNNY